MKKSISPVRYPGGKAKVYDLTVNLLRKNNLIGKTYMEPFAGGCGLALLLLQNNIVSNLVLNDIDRSIYALWYSILNRTEEFVELIDNAILTLEERENQRQIQGNKEIVDILELGFSTFYLNRVNHSGIIKGGVIGGIKQEGKYKMDCRFNKKNLIKQVRNIALMRDRIEFYNMDVINFIDEILPNKPLDSFLFIDPPYYKKGPWLYVNSYNHEDHLRLSEKIKNDIHQHWIITYDSVKEIKSMYTDKNQREFDINYSLREKGTGVEVMIFSDSIISTF